jgi:hypothetical protein
MILGWEFGLGLLLLIPFLFLVLSPFIEPSLGYLPWPSDRSCLLRPHKLLLHLVLSSLDE